MHCIIIPSVQRSFLLQCTLVALACCTLVPRPCSGDDGREEAFLDAQTLVEGWDANYGHIDSFKVRCSRILLEEKGQNPVPRKRTQFFLEERIQDGTKFLARSTRSPQGFDDADDYAVSSFDGSISKEYTYMSGKRGRQLAYKVNSDGSTSKVYVRGGPRGESRAHGMIYRGLRGMGNRGMTPFGLFLGTVPSFHSSEKGQPPKVRSTAHYPLGIPTFIRWYNIAVEMDGVLVRPYLESVAGESCHVLELHLSHANEVFWLAHEKGMLLMKKKWVSNDGIVGRATYHGKVAVKEAKEIASVTTDKGVLWYPHVIMEEQIKGPNYSYTTKVTVHEFVPYFKAPAETFKYVFPSGTRVSDRIKDVRYTVGESKTAMAKAPDELQNMDSEPVADEPAPLLQEGDNKSDGRDVFTNSIGMKLKLIEPGSFVMGSDSGADNETPVHRVMVTKPFFIGVYEVTQQQYEKVMGANPSRFKGPRRPVDTVSWDDASEFCRRLSETESRPYRLPTEAQWEYACRCDTTTEYYWGDKHDDRYAWTHDNTRHTRRDLNRSRDVGTRLPNAWGLHDMSGNVSEWCADFYDAHYPNRTGQSDPKGPSGGQSRVLRGGCWYDAPWRCRSAYRYGGEPDLYGDDIGFRIVLNSN